MHMKSWILGAAAAVATATSVPATAEVYIGDFTLGSYGSGTANITTAGDASSGMSLITALSGTYNGNSITLLAPGTYPDFVSPQNDNLFTTASPFFDLSGLGFSAGGFNYNLYAVGPALAFCTNQGGNTCQGGLEFSVTSPAVPEPATWAMMLLGFVAVGYSLRRKRSLIAQVA